MSPLFPRPRAARLRLKGEAVARWAIDAGCYNKPDLFYQHGPLFLTNLSWSGYMPEFEAEFVVRATGRDQPPDTDDAGELAAWVIEQARQHIPAALRGSDLSVEVEQPTR